MQWRSLHPVDEIGARLKTRQHARLCSRDQRFPLPTGVALEPVLRAEHFARGLSLNKRVLHGVLDAGS